MASTQEAKLNLVLTATDTASKVIGEFVQKTRAQFEELKSILGKGINPQQLLNPVREAVTGINEELGRINPAGAERAIKKITEAEFVAVADMQRMFEELKRNINNASLEVVRAGDLTASQLKRILQEVGALPKNVEAVRNRFAESFNKIDETLYVTREKAVELLRSMSSEFTNESLKAVEAAQLTNSALKQILSAVMNQRVEIVRSLDSIESSYKKLSGTLNQKLDFVGLQMAGQMVEDFGRRGLEFFGSAVKSAADFDQEIYNTIASMKAMNPELKTNQALFEALKNAALDLGTQGYFSANEVAQALNTLAKQGVEGQQTLIAAVHTVHDVAAANQMDLEATANVVSDIFHEFGDQLKTQFKGDVTAAFRYIGDNMTSALHHARMSMEDYLNTLKYVGPLASQAGWSLHETSVAIALLAEHGIRGSQAGTTLRRMLTNLNPASKKAAEAMKELGFITEEGGNIFYDAHGKVKPFEEILQILHERFKQLTPQEETFALKTLFGQYSLAGMAAISDTTKQKLQDLVKGFGQAGVTQQALAEKSHGLGMQLNRLSATFETLKKDIGEQLKGPIMAIIPILTHLMQSFMHLDPSVKKAIVLFGAVASAVAVVGGAIMAAIGTIGMLAESFASGLEVLAALNPYVAIAAAAIAALIGIVVALKAAWNSNFGHIRQITASVWNWIKQQFNSAMNTIRHTVQQGVTALSQWWHKIGPDAEKAFNRLVAAVKALAPVWKGAWEVLKFVVKLAWDAIISTIQHAWGLLSGIFQLIVHLINGQWKQAWNDLKQIVFNALMLVLDFFRVKWLGPLAKGLLEFVLKFKWLRGQTLQEVTGLVKGATKMWDEFWSYTKKLFGDAAKALGEILQKLMNTLSDLWHAGASLLKGDIKGFWSNVKEAFSGGKETAVSIIKAMLQAFDNLFGGLPGKALRWATNQMNSFISGIRGKVGEVLGAVRGLLSSIDSAFGGLPGRALSWGLNMMRNFYNGIVAFVGRIKDKVMEVASWIKDHLGHFSPAKKGPLSTDDKWFPNMMKMFIAGIEAHRPGLQKALGKVAMDINANLNPTSSGGDKQPLTQQLLNPITQRLKQISQLTAARHVIGEDPFSKAEPSNSYDRRAGHSRNIPPTISLYDRYAGHGAHHVTVNIQIEGRSKETDRQLINQLVDHLGRKLRTHVPMHIG